MQHWLVSVCLSLVLALASVGPSWGGNTHPTLSPVQELGAWAGDAMVPYLVSGCLPAVPSSSLILAAFACKGYLRGAAGDLIYVDQAAKTLGPVSNVNGVDWLAIHRNTSQAVGGWNRAPGTHYLWQRSVTQPVDPAEGMVVARITVAGAVITDVTSLARRCPMTSSPRVFDVTCYGADNTGTRDMGYSLRLACDALQSAGGGTLVFPPGTYKLYAVGTTYTQPCQLTDLVGVQLLSHGATLAIDSTRVFTTSYATTFNMVRMTNLTIDGFNVTGPTLPVQDTAVVGVELFFCLQCTNIVMPHNRVHGVIVALKLQSSGGVSTPGTKSKNIHVGVLDVRDSFYGILTQFCCDDVTVERLVTNHVHRSFFSFGDTHRNSVRVFSTNPTSTDVIFASLLGYAPRDIDLWYTNELTDNAYMNQPFVTVGWSDETPGLIANVTVHLQVAYQVPTGANFNGSTALRIHKFNAATNPDSADHGHILRNLKVTGRISGTSTTSDGGPISTNEANGQRQGTGDFWSNILFENLYIEPTAVGFSFSIGSVTDQVTLMNVTAPWADLRNAVNSFYSPAKIALLNSTIGNAYAPVSSVHPLLFINAITSPTHAVSAGWVAKVLLNGAVGDMTWFLPTATVGQSYSFVRNGANLVKIDPNGSEVIRGCGAGKYYSMTNQYDRVSLQVLATGTWEIVAAAGAAATCEP